MKKVKLRKRKRKVYFQYKPWIPMSYYKRAVELHKGVVARFGSFQMVETGTSKYPHKYVCAGEFPLNHMSFTIEFDGIKYGHYEAGFIPNEKFRYLRSLVLTKQRLIEDLYRVKRNIEC